MCRDYRYHNVDTWEVMEDQSRSGHRASIIDLSFFRTSSTLGASVKYAVSRIDTIFYTCVFSSIHTTNSEHYRRSLSTIARSCRRHCSVLSSLPRMVARTEAGVRTWTGGQ